MAARLPGAGAGRMIGWVGCCRPQGLEGPWRPSEGFSLYSEEHVACYDAI